MEAKIQEFGPTVTYIKSQKNIEADALSQLPMTSENIEVMLNHPHIYPHNHLLNKYPLDLEFIQHHQRKYPSLIKALEEDKYFLEILVCNLKLIHHHQKESTGPKIDILYALKHQSIIPYVKTF